MAYSIDGRISYSECDESGRLSIFSLVNRFQDTSVFHCEDIYHGIGYLAEKGLAWFITSWNIEIRRLPALGEHVRTSTWCHAMKHLISQRAFTLETADGELLAIADSQWFLYDFATGQPIRVPDEEAEPFLANLGEAPDMEKAPRRIRVEGDGEAAEAIAVGHALLDTNGHVNNARYVEMALQAAGIDEASRVQVQYKQAAVEGDLILPHIHSDGEGTVVRLASDGEGDDYAVVRLVP